METELFEMFSLGFPMNTTPFMWTGAVVKRNSDGIVLGLFKPFGEPAANDSE
jgi:hypothetical protein